MSTAQEIAVKLGVKTADQAGPPTKTPKGKKIEWTLTRRVMMKALQPVALCLVATNGPVSVEEFNLDGTTKRRFGHNRGVWPVRLVNGGTWRDTATTIWDRNPMMKISMKLRIWVHLDEERDRLREYVTDYLAKCAEADGSLEPFDHDFLDMGADLNLGSLEKTLHDIAKRNRILAWNDEGFVACLDQIYQEVRTAEAERGMKTSPRLIENFADRHFGALRGRL